MGTVVSVGHRRHGPRLEQELQGPGERRPGYGASPRLALPDNVSDLAAWRARRGAADASTLGVDCAGLAAESEITSLDDLGPEPTGPVRSFTELLASGIPHKGGLAQIAAMEADGTLYGGQPLNPIPLFPTRDEDADDGDDKR